MDQWIIDHQIPIPVHNKEICKYSLQCFDSNVKCLFFVRKNIEISDKQISMAKLLKHFGLGYGNSKKSDTFDLRAKTLPASTSDRDSLRAVADTTKSSGRKNPGASAHALDGDDCGRRNACLSSHASRRASHETFLTIPARGSGARSERYWSLRGVKNRDTLQPASGLRDSKVTDFKKRSNPDTNDLRRSVTTDEMSSRNASVPPAVCINQCGMVFDMVNHLLRSTGPQLLQMHSASCIIKS